MAQRRWIQHPITLELIPRDEYVRPKDTNSYIIGEIEGFVSPIDGSIVGSRRQMREHMQKHNVVPQQEFSTEWLTKRREKLDSEIQSKAASKERKQMIYESWTKAESN